MLWARYGIWRKEEEVEHSGHRPAGRSRELDRVKIFLEGIVGNLGVGVVVLDEEGRVQVWNANSSELWGMRADEAQGQRFVELDIGFPVARLEEPIRQAALDGAEPFDEVVEAVTWRGQSVQCRVRTLPLRDGGGEASGTIILMAAGDRAPMSS